MERVPEPDLPPIRAALPEGCSDLVEAYKIRDENQKQRDGFRLRISALLHDSFFSQLSDEEVTSPDPDLLRKRVSDFLHPLLLSNPELEKLVSPTSELVETLLHVVMANLDEQET